MKKYIGGKVVWLNNENGMTYYLEVGDDGKQTLVYSDGSREPYNLWPYSQESIDKNVADGRWVEIQ